MRNRFIYFMRCLAVKSGLKQHVRGQLLMAEIINDMEGWAQDDMWIDTPPDMEKGMIGPLTRLLLAEHGMDEKQIAAVEKRIANGGIKYNGRIDKLMEYLGLKPREAPLVITLEGERESAQYLRDMAEKERKTFAQIVDELIQERMEKEEEASDAAQTDAQAEAPDAAQEAPPDAAQTPAQAEAPDAAQNPAHEAREPPITAEEAQTDQAVA